MIPSGRRCYRNRTTDECYRDEHAKVGSTEGPADRPTSSMPRLHSKGEAQTGGGLCYSYENPHCNQKQVIHICKF